MMRIRIGTGSGGYDTEALNRAILDSGMLRLRSLLAYKMPLHGGELKVVSAAYTSQTCSRCGARNAPGASKIYECAECGVVLDRDDNASQNIKAAASCTAAPLRESVAASRGAAVRPRVKALRHAALIRPSEGDMTDHLPSNG
jgi:putative transposase